MKTKLSPGAIWTLVIVSLCVACFIVVPAIVAPDAAIDGGNHATDGGDHAGHNHDIGEIHVDSDTPHTTNKNQNAHNNTEHKHTTPHNKSAMDSFQSKPRDNGTYTYTVTARSGHVYECDSILMSEPTVTEISNDIIKVSGQHGKKNPLSAWAVYYNVAGEGVEAAFSQYVLGSTDTKVAYLYGNNGKFFVAVCNPFDKDKVLYTPLPDMPLTENSHPDLHCNLTKAGELQVVCTTADGEETVTVNMN